ncbi:MAG: hypothetical protein ACC652_10405 [Acidimicrobiales bacterium]
MGLFRKRGFEWDGIECDVVETLSGKLPNGELRATLVLPVVLVMGSQGTRTPIRTDVIGVISDWINGRPPEFQQPPESAWSQPGDGEYPEDNR